MENSEEGAGEKRGRKKGHRLTGEQRRKGANRGMGLVRVGCSSLPLPEAPVPEEATAACPGTETKILVMIDRINRGFQLHHPDDLKMGRDEECFSNLRKLYESSGQRQDAG